MKGFLANIIHRHIHPKDSVEPRPRSLFEPYDIGLAPSAVFQHFRYEEDPENFERAKSPIGNKVGNIASKENPFQEQDREIEAHPISSDKRPAIKSKSNIPHKNVEPNILNILSTTTIEQNEKRVSLEVESENPTSPGPIKKLEEPKKTLIKKSKEGFEPREIPDKQNVVRRPFSPLRQIEKRIEPNFFHINPKILQNQRSQQVENHFNIENSFKIPGKEISPTVKIRIGRIEIRATKEIPKKGQKIQEAKKPRVSLDQFLKNRESKLK